MYHDNALVRDVLDYTEADQFDCGADESPLRRQREGGCEEPLPRRLASSETADLFMAVIMYRLKKGGRAAVILPDGFLFGTDNAKVNLKKEAAVRVQPAHHRPAAGSVFSPYTSITTNILFFDRTGPTRETWYYRLDMPEGLSISARPSP